VQDAEGMSRRIRGGNTKMSQPWEEFDSEDEKRECSESCPHFDGLNQCCWQSGPWGILIEISEGDACHLGYKEDDGR